MASLLRQIVAGPRARHPEAGLDLCYVTDSIIATSGPSQTYPQLAYRNPLDQLVSFLDTKHGEDWAIWEFRAEGTGYPDEAVYGRVRHYPWPDHHPPPFRLVPMIMASMRNWLHGGGLDAMHPPPERTAGETKEPHPKRVAVVHCKAGKGRSGTISCSYLVSEEGWTAEKALARFTQRRMRPQFGAGVSIPSQLRWISYVDRWTNRGGKKYVDKAVEIIEIHIWGLRNGVKIDVEGFMDEGKKIHVFHTFSKTERLVMESGPPAGKGAVADMALDLAAYTATGGSGKVPSEVELADAANEDDRAGDASVSVSGSEMSTGHNTKRQSLLARKGTSLVQKVSTGLGNGLDKANKAHGSQKTSSEKLQPSEGPEPGGQAVILRPSKPIIIPNSDVNIAVERRNKSPKALNLTVVSALAHVWFNAFFDGHGPEQDGHPDDNGVFSIDWDAMDGIKGSSRKGSRAMDRMSVVWRYAGPSGGGEEIVEPGEGEPVPQVAAADWKGASTEGGVQGEKHLGLRTQTMESKDVSRASSVKSAEVASDGDGEEGLKSSGPEGEELAVKDG